MFRNAIQSTPLTDDVAEQFFDGKITGMRIGEDCSFLATLRALVYPRMGDDDRLDFKFQSSVTAPPINRLMSCIEQGGTISSPRIHIYNFPGQSSANSDYFKQLQDEFEKVYDGWHRLTKVTDFFRKAFTVLCFINTDKKSVILFTDNLDIAKMHYLQCAIFAFLPWYFDPKVGVTEQEMELIESLRNKTPDKYEYCIAQIAKQYDFKTMRIKNLLGGFETRFEKEECERLRNDIQNYIRAINNYNDMIAGVLHSKEDTEIRLLGLESKIAREENNDSEIMEYFLSNDKLVLENVSDSAIAFSCWGYLEYFDDEMAQQMIDNERSYIYIDRMAGLVTTLYRKTICAT